MVDLRVRHVHEEIEQRVKPHLDEVVKLKQQLAELHQSIRASGRLHNEAEVEPQGQEGEPGVQSPQRVKGRKSKMGTGQLLDRLDPRSDATEPRQTRSLELSGPYVN